MTADLGALVLAALLSAPASTPPADAGAALYARHCLVCHQADGGGVPAMQPPLLDSPIVTGPPELLIRWTLMGTPDPTRPGLWANAMPGFGQLSDGELAAILTYVRRELPHAVKGDLSPVSADDVKAGRDRL